MSINLFPGGNPSNQKPNPIQPEIFPKNKAEVQQFATSTICQQSTQGNVQTTKIHHFYPCPKSLEMP